MGREEVKLKVKSGWKLYQSIAGTVAFGAMGYLIIELIRLREYVGTTGLLLALFFVLSCGLILYKVAYSHKHEVVFDDSGMRRKGVIKEKVIPYSDIDKVHFSDSFWRVSLTSKVLGSNIYFIDYRYQKSGKAIALLRNILDSKKTELVLN